MLKGKYNVIFWSLWIVIGFALSACLKNNKYFINYAGAGTLIEMPLAAPVANNPPNILPGGYSIINYGAYADTVTYAADTISTQVYVNVASPSVPGSANNATLAIDTAALDSMNVALGGVWPGYTSQTNYGPKNYSAGWTFNFAPIPDLTYELLPDSVYTVTSWKVNIPAGQRLSPLVVTLTPHKIDTTTTMQSDANGNPTRVLNHNYILPVTIVSASQKISNYNTVLVNIQIVSPSSYNYPQY